MESIITIKEINEKSTWDNFLQTTHLGYFLQSWQWGDFLQQGLKKNIHRLGIYNIEDKLVGLCLGSEENSRYGKFIYCARGPIINWENQEQRAQVLHSLTQHFNNKGYILLRLDPTIKKENLTIHNEFKTFGFKDAVNFIQVERAWMLDLTKSEEEILNEMRKNTRYYLKKAQKAGVEVTISQDQEEFEQFLIMLEGIANKKDFNMLPKSYLRSQFEILIKDGILKFFCAKYNGKPVAGGVFAFYNDEASYLHGASSDDVGDTQAPYLIQWEAIKHAKSLGLKKYNFWGVVEDKNYHPGYSGFGYSNFKKGFGGYLEEYVRTQDYMYNPLMYTLFRLNEWYRKVKYKGN